MTKSDHAPNFPLKTRMWLAHAKDMAAWAGVEHSVMNQAESLLHATREDSDLNFADEDFSGVLEEIHKQSASDFSKKRMEKKQMLRAAQGHKL